MVVQVTLHTPPDVAETWESHPEQQHLDRKKWDGWGQRVVERLSTRRGWSPEGVWLEWGCGGGAICNNALWTCEAYFAVDVSARAREACKSLLPSGDPLIQLHVMGPEDAARLRPGFADVVVSAACFQHFPSRAYTREVLCVMRSALKRGGPLKEGGHGLIQIRFTEAPEPEDTRPYSERFIDATSWTIPEFWKELVSAGFTPLAVEIELPDIAWYTFDG